MRRLFGLTMFLTALASLANLFGVSEATAAVDGKKIKVMTTIFPQYDFIREIAGDKVELSMMIRPGSESHSFEPSPMDIIKIRGSDLFVYVGGEGDKWIDRILLSAADSKVKVVPLMSMVEVVEEEIVEGMQDGHGHEHGHGHGFEDHEVKDRLLGDWSGQWQSVYPLLLDGSLDEVMSHKAEESEGEKTKEDFYKQYDTGYSTDVDKLVIDNGRITFYVKGEPRSASYEYKGFQIRVSESGNKGVRYQFEATDAEEGLPRFVQFSDHVIEPAKSEHFHIYWGNDGFDALLEAENWPTYYPASMSAKEIAHDMLGHGHAHHGEEKELDEHVWTSPKNARIIVLALAENLAELDPENAKSYRANARAYAAKLDELDASFKKVVSEGNRKTLVFGDRFPFRYFADAYGLDYFAAFPGCSTETEPSVATVAFLIDKVKQDKIPVVFHIELSNERMADTICEATGAKKLLFHSCHNITRDDFAKGLGYLSLMERNVENLKEALE